MMSETKSEALAVLSEVCELSPDVRLGQLLAHIGFLGEDHVERSLWNIDDEQLLAILYHHRAELTSRAQATPNESLQTTGPAHSVSANIPSQQAGPAAER